MQPCTTREARKVDIGRSISQTDHGFKVGPELPNREKLELHWALACLMPPLASVHDTNGTAQVKRSPRPPATGTVDRADRVDAAVRLLQRAVRRRQQRRLARHGALRGRDIQVRRGRETLAHTRARRHSPPVAAGGRRPRVSRETLRRCCALPDFGSRRPTARAGGRQGRRARPSALALAALATSTDVLPRLRRPPTFAPSSSSSRRPSAACSTKATPRRRCSTLPTRRSSETSGRQDHRSFSSR